MVWGEKGQAEAKLLHPDRGHDVPGLPWGRNVEPEYQAERGLPLSEPGHPCPEAEQLGCYGNTIFP